MEMKDQRFGIEIEMTGLTRERAAQVTAEYFGTQAVGTTALDSQRRQWRFVYDGSINTQRREGGQKVAASDSYAVEMVSPICVWEDIETVQEIVRKLRSNNAFGNSSCGIHVHVDGSPFDARTLRNLTNIMYCKEDLIYKALKVDVAREHRYCRKTEQRFLDELNARKPQSLEDVSRIWYNGNDRSSYHYDDSRYRCLNLHSLFGKGTIEFRLFNSDIRHCGKIKAYIQLCMAITNQALNQRSASIRKTQSANEKYTFRTWLLRLGLIGDEFKTARTHLLENLDGCIAWKDPAQAELQKERMRQRREAKQAQERRELEAREQAPEHETTQQNTPEPEIAEEELCDLSMSM